MPTIIDVARKAGVASGTASEIINSGHIHKFTRGTVEKVRQAAVDIGYKVNRSAQALRTQRTRMIGIAVYGDQSLGAFAQPYVANVYQGIGNFFASREYKLIFENYSPERGFKHLSDLGHSGQVDGIIFVLLAPQVQQLIKGEADFLNDLQLPHVVVHSLNRELSHPAVGIDTSASVRLALEHFTQVHGYRSVGYVGSGHTDSHIKELETAFTVLAPEFGLQMRPEWMIPGSYGTENGIKAVAKLLKDGTELPRALYVADTSTADGMVHAFRQGGIRVPEDIAIIGFGDIVDEFYHVHGLTSINQRPRAKGAAAAEMLLNRLDDRECDTTVTIQPELVVRTSCGCS